MTLERNIRRDAGFPDDLDGRLRVEAPGTARSTGSSGVSVVATGLRVRGNLRGTGALQIQGLIEGEIALRGPIQIAQTGTARGSVSATTVDVFGVQDGPLSAARVVVRAGGAILGDVRASELVLEDGGQIEGSVEIDGSNVDTQLGRSDV